MKALRCWTLALAAALAGGIMGRAEAPPVPDAAAAGTAGAGRGVEVLRPALEKEVWSNKTVTQSPSGKRTFLGPFGCESNALSLDNLPEHGRVRLSFDLMIMLTWDGDANLDQPNGDGPDLLDVTVAHGPRLLHASFGCRPAGDSLTQSYPGRFPYDHVPVGTGVLERNTLGYQWPGQGPDYPHDYVYHVERTFGHSGKSLKIAFSGINLQAKEDESWGLANVRVEVLPGGAGGTFDEAAFGKMWGDLGSADWKAFVPAIEGMIDLGDPGVVALRQRLVPPAGGGEQAKLVEKLMGQLDDDAVREKASAGLRQMGPAAEAALRAAREKATSPEVCVRIDELLERLKDGELESEAGRRMRRLVEVLERIGTEEAREGLKDISKRGRPLAAWEAKGALERLAGKAEIPTKLDLPPGLPRSGPVAPPPSPEPFNNGWGGGVIFEFD